MRMERRRAERLGTFMFLAKRLGDDGRPLNAREEQMLQYLYEFFDADMDAGIEPHELHRGLRHLGQYYSKEQCCEMVEMVMAAGSEMSPRLPLRVVTGKKQEPLVSCC